MNAPSRSSAFSDTGTVSFGRPYAAVEPIDPNEPPVPTGPPPCDPNQAPPPPPPI